MPLTFGTPEYRINNAITAGYQGKAVGAALQGQGYVILWETQGLDQNDSLAVTVVGQCFTYNGQPYGNQFQVSTAAGSESLPSVVGIGQYGMVAVSRQGRGGACGRPQLRRLFFW